MIELIAEHATCGVVLRCSVGDETYYTGPCNGTADALRHIFCLLFEHENIDLDCNPFSVTHEFS